MGASCRRRDFIVSAKSDSELKVQGFSQNKITLSREQEALSREYANATSNQIFMLRTDKGTTELTVGNLPTNLRFRLPGGGAIPSDMMTKMRADNGTTPDGYLQFLLTTGQIILQQQDDAGAWTNSSPGGNTNIQQSFYDKDDPGAKAKYDAGMQRINIKEQRIDLDIKSEETKHKALETEEESVKKVIDKNIEGSFKAFA